MIKRNISWEIILAGLAFIGIGMYMFNNMNSSDSTNRSAAWSNEKASPSAPTTPSLPGAIVIDLKNLESLKNLEKLRHLNDLENIEQLKFEIKNLDDLIKQHAQNDLQDESLDVELQKLEKELQKIDQTDFNFKLQDQKLYIHKNYNIDESQWTEVGSGEYVYKDTFSTTDLQSIDFSTGFGNLNIIGNGSSTGEITLRATGDVDGPSAISNQINIQKTISGQNASFEVNSVSGSSISNKVNLEATLTLPKNIALAAKTSGGHITASHLKNAQDLSTSGGHINLSDIHGKTTAKTSGGHITSNNTSGEIKVRTGGGHIKIKETEGSLEAKTGGGHIEIQDAKGSIMARTSGGNISSSIIEANNQLSFKTSAGNVSLVIPKEINANLDISGSSVQLDDVFNFSGQKNPGQVTGKLNDGGLPIVISCGYGNVNISAHK